MLSAWAGNYVGTSTWLVSVQFQKSAKGIWGKQGHGEHSSSALQGENPLAKGIISFSCNAPKLIAGKSLVHPGICNSSKITSWSMLHPLFCSWPSPPVARGKGASFIQQNEGMEPFHLPVHREWQRRASTSESSWNTDTCPQMDEVKWNFFTIVLQLFAQLKNYINLFLKVIRLVLSVQSMKQTGTKVKKLEARMTLH